jgi:hypothetical protein
MLRKEADELKKLIDSFVEESSTTTTNSNVESVKYVDELPEISEGEVIPPEIDPIPQPKQITELELKKMFRNQVPENFDPNKVELVRSPMTGDRVFMKYDGTRRWMPDPETMEKLGFTMGDVRETTDEEVKELTEKFGLLSAKLW